MNDTSRRFLTGILQRVRETHVVDVRLFPPIRQGGIESGVAVLAVEPGFDILTAEAAAVSPLEGEAMAPDATPDAQALTTEEDGAADGLPLEREVPIDAEGMVALADVVVAELERERARDRERDDLVATAEIAADLADAPTAEMVVEPELVSGAADLSAPAEETVALGDMFALPSPESHHATPSVDRLAILCARYKLVFKGPERGKWDLEITHHADAPLEALERVIAGVVRRAGDATEPVRYDATSLRDALNAPAWVDGPAA